MDGASLISFLDTPFLVGDPDGRVVYVNPAFERRFCPEGEQLQGVELASLFEGGGREALLNAVAEVCNNGQTARFRMREERRGYLGLVSPIEARGEESTDRVGVVILLVDEPAIHAKLQAVHREIEEPLEEAMSCLEQLIEQTGGRRNEAFRGAVERGLAALVRARKWSEELDSALNGRSDRKAAVELDPVRVVREVGSRLQGAFDDASVKLDLLVPAQLPAALADPDQLEAALVRLLRLRLATAETGTSLTIAARVMGQGDRRAVLITVVDRPRSGDEHPDEREPQSVCEAVAPHGGRVHTVWIPKAGRATAIRLSLASPTA
jgi:PAS domain-containing protein